MATKKLLMTTSPVGPAEPKSGLIYFLSPLRNRYSYMALFGDWDTYVQLTDGFLIFKCATRERISVYLMSRACEPSRLEAAQNMARGKVNKELTTSHLARGDATATTRTKLPV